MAKNRFNIKPKLGGSASKPKKLPVQNISVEQIEKIAINKKAGSETSKKTPEQIKGKVKTPAKTTKKGKTAATTTVKQKKKPQGRPPRTEAVKRLSSDLPAQLYDKVKEEVKMNGYSLNGFLAKVIREYFDRKERN